MIRLAHRSPFAPFLSDAIEYDVSRRLREGGDPSGNRTVIPAPRPCSHAVAPRTRGKRAEGGLERTEITAVKPLLATPPSQQDHPSEKPQAAPRVSRHTDSALPPMHVKRTSKRFRALKAALAQSETKGTKRDDMSRTYVYVKPELTRTHVCQSLSWVCSGRGFGRPPPARRAGGSCGVGGTSPVGPIWPISILA